MTDRYAVFGNPVAHSRSPAIHAAFALQTGQDMSYEAILAPLDGFAAALSAFAAAGGRGANVTLPFKREAWRLADLRSTRAEAAGAVNTVRFDATGMFGDNTDGAGLIADVCGNLGFPLAGRSVLVIGAGGAARGALLPLIEQSPGRLVIANRNLRRAESLADEFSRKLPAQPSGIRLEAKALDALGSRPYDLVIDATSAGLAGERLPLPQRLFSRDSLAYSMIYGPAAAGFLGLARMRGAARCADGLGMLVEQAAESFRVWRGLRPETAPVIARLRAECAA
ncbi:MAG: shikimate dehydrogenase [Rhodocyclaceae bacterium]